jgi:hypothetical protein
MQEPADRSISALLYLTTPESGGHTTFPVVNVSVPPKTGRLLLFQSLDANGRCDPLSAHIGHAPSSGGIAKFAWQKWFLASPSPADRRAKELAARSAMQTMCGASEATLADIMHNMLHLIAKRQRLPTAFPKSCLSAKLPACNLCDTERLCRPGAGLPVIPTDDSARQQIHG